MMHMMLCGEAIENERKMWWAKTNKQIRDEQMTNSQLSTVDMRLCRDSCKPYRHPPNVRGEVK